MDTIANMFSQLKNAGSVGKKEVFVSFSKLNLTILALLKTKGFIADFKTVTTETQKYPKILVIFAFKANSELAFNDIRRVSRSGCRIYVGSNRIYKIMRGKAEVIMSTPQGVMGGAEARKKHLGGEVLGEVV